MYISWAKNLSQSLSNCPSASQYLCIVPPLSPLTYLSTCCELGEHLSLLGRTDVGRQWFQKVYFRNRKLFPNDRQVGGELHLIGDAGRSPSADLFCHFVVCWGDNKMLVSSWWWNYVLWGKCERNFWPPCYNCLIWWGWENKLCF